MSTANQPAAPGVMQHTEAPEWTVVYVPHPGYDEHPNRIGIYQNGVLMVDAVDDVQTGPAVDDLVKRANHHAALVAEVEGLRKALGRMIKNFEAVPIPATEREQEDMAKARTLLAGKGGA